MSEKSEHARLEAFCDGVFAIAITLLILEIKIPPVDSLLNKAAFWHYMQHNWPSWFGFVLSFTIIFIAWTNHHNIFKMIHKSSPQFTYANGLLLLTVVIIPFSTGLMSEFLTTGLQQPAISIYCFTILFHNLSWILFSIAALKPASLFINDELKKTFIKVVYISSSFAALFYSALCVFSFWFPLLSMTLMTLTWIYWVFTAIRAK